MKINITISRPVIFIAILMFCGCIIYGGIIRRDVRTLSQIVHTQNKTIEILILDLKTRVMADQATIADLKHLMGVLDADAYRRDQESAEIKKDPSDG